ncbi:MAG: phage holin family protein [Acidobacteriota bacterium]
MTDASAKQRKPNVGELVGNLGKAGVALAQAEARSVRSELGGTTRLAVRSGIWGLVAGTLCFWGGAVLTAALVVGLSQRLSLLVSLLIVGAALVGLGLIAAVIARARIKRLESPARSLKRRATSHMRWWRDELGMGPAVEDSEL